MTKTRTVIIAAVIILSQAAFACAIELNDFIYQSKGRRDPFVPLVVTTRAPVNGLQGVRLIEDIALEGIVWDEGGNSIAVLNGVIVSEGQRVEDVEIVQIEQTSVTLLLNKKEFTLILKEKGD